MVEEALIIMSLINNRYPGGIAQWEDDGGRMLAVPSPANEIVLWLPQSAPGELTKDIKKVSKRVAILPLIQEPSEEVVAEVSKLVQKVPTVITFHSGVMVILFATISVKSERAQELLKSLMAVGDIVLLYALDRNGGYEKKSQDFFDVAPKRKRAPKKCKTAVKQEAGPETPVSIHTDDILNLRIALETTQDVNDFINSL